MKSKSFYNNGCGLEYAINRSGELVHVDDVPTGLDCECFCPACKEPLIAKNQGEIRLHHFAHKSGTECKYAQETMLHLLAKEKIQEAFLSKPNFWIRFYYESYCQNYNECKYYRKDNCFNKNLKSFDLKTLRYDSCEQETKYNNNNRRSDLKIYSSIKKDREPIYIEFFVTHASDEKKLHSFNRIIEIKIESVEDIINISQNGISEENRNVHFYGFKKEGYDNNSISTEVMIFRYILLKNGKSLYKPYQLHNCKKEITKFLSDSLLEIYAYDPIEFSETQRLKYIGYQQFNIKNCCLCMNYVNSYNNRGKICRCYKSLGMQLYEDLDTARAKGCRYFKINEKEMKEAIEKGLGEIFTILK